MCRVDPHKFERGIRRFGIEIVGSGSVEPVEFIRRTSISAKRAIDPIGSAKIDHLGRFGLGGATPRDLHCAAERDRRRSIARFRTAAARRAKT